MNNDNVIHFPIRNTRISGAIQDIAANMEFVSALEKLPDAATLIDMIVALPNGKNRRYVIQIEAETEA